MAMTDSHLGRVLRFMQTEGGWLSQGQVALGMNLSPIDARDALDALEDLALADTSILADGRLVWKAAA